MGRSAVSDHASPLEPPLCVDLDGTLIAGDTLIIACTALARRKPWVLPLLPLILLRGRAALKDLVSRHVELDPIVLPWREPVLAFLRAEHARGRRLILATAADQRIAAIIAKHVGLFELVIAADGRTNTKGLRKVEAIRQAIGADVFDYVGDSHADLAVFAAARKGYLVAPSRRLAELASRVRNVEITILSV
jgi:phosphoserine phosphatase